MRSTIVLLTLALACQGAAEQTAFAVTRPLSAVTEREELAAIPLDRHVYATTRDGHPDLRVLDATGQAVPHLLLRHTQTRTQWEDHAEPARRVQDLLPDAEGNRIEAVVEPPRKDPPAWIEIITPLRDFEKHVSVYAPAGAGAWQALRENQAIYDYSRFMDVRRCRVLLPEAPAAPRYRITLSDVSEASASAFVEMTTRSGGGQPDQETVRRVLQRRDFRIDRIDFGYRVRVERRAAPVLVDYPLHITGTERDEKAGLTRITVDTGRLPITELRFAFADRNVSRPVTVEVRRSLDDGTYQWLRIGQGTLARIDFHNVKEEALCVSVTETRAEELRITMADRDSPPLAVEAITAVCPLDRVVFLAQPGVSYALAYGSTTVAAPRYEDAVLRHLSDLKDREVRALPMQPAEAAAAYPQERLWVRLLNSRSVLIAALGLAVVVLAWAMVHAARRIAPPAARSQPPGPGA